IAVLVDREPALRVERESVRARLSVFADIHTAVAAMGAIDGNSFVLGPAINQVVVGIAEEQVPAVRDPHRSCREQESAGDLFDLRARRNNRVESIVLAHNLGVDLLDARAVAGLVKIKCRGFYPDEIHRAFRNGAVESENGDLEFLTRLSVPRQDD